MSNNGIKKGFAAVALGMLLLCVPGAGSSPPRASIVSDDPETIALGARLFLQNCSPCHGIKGVGEDQTQPGGGLKPDIGHIAPALNGSGHAWHHPPEYFFQMIRDGTFRKNSRMAGWKGRMNDYEILAVVSYFQSLWPRHIKDAYRRRYLMATEK